MRSAVRHTQSESPDVSSQYDSREAQHALLSWATIANDHTHAHVSAPSETLPPLVLLLVPPPTPTHW